MYNLELLEYMNQFIDVEAVSIFLLSVFIASIIFCIAFYFGNRYGKTLERAVEKHKRGEELTKKEYKIWLDFQEYLYR